MNRLAHWMMRLYPARWRRRYGDELDALITDTGADARIVADLLRGGVRMQFSTWSFAKLAMVLGFGGLLMAGLGSLLLPNMYVSQATVRVQQPEDVMSRLGPLVLSRSTLAAVINEPELQLYRNEQKTRPLEDVIELMRRSIRIDALTLPGASSPSALHITFTYPDSRKAQQTVAALIEKFRQVSDEQHLKSESLQRATQPLLDVIDTPSLPGAPFHSNIWFIVIPGALLSAAVPYVRRRLKKRRLATWGFVASTIAMGLFGFVSVCVLATLDRLNWGNHFVSDEYRSTALMSAQNITPEQLQALVTQALSRTSLSRIINDPRLLLYKNEQKTKPLEDVIQEMQRHLSIAVLNRNPRYFGISFDYSDRFGAQMTVQALINTIDEINRAESAGLPGAPAGVPVDWGTLSVQNAPSLDLDPVAPNRPNIAAMGGGAGLLLAALISLIRNRWKPEGEIPVDAVNG